MNKRREIERNNLSDSEGDLIQKRTKSLLGGDFLTNDTSARQLPFLLFLMFLGILYIANVYYSEANNRDIDNLKKEVKELRFEHISTKSKLMQLSKQSELVKVLKDKGIKESTVPPYKIIVKAKKEE
ncbi:MAG: hypothetical protein CL663_03950 [Bacteroidetes bacterium]|nr:hypothetical protein [Bacteroidota bacterium]|tara:strand:+ start:211 stop:591 length:381 start_codon:yes stop_codon:yes gene_type:complete